MGGPARLSRGIQLPRLKERPDPAGVEGAILYTFDAGGITVLEGVVETGGVFRFLRDQLFIGLNNTAAPIAGGTLVRATGWAQDASGNEFVTVAPASSAGATTMPAAGLLAAGVLPGEKVRVWQIGPVGGLNTLGMAKDADVYVGLVGAFTTQPPSAGRRLQRIGKVLVEHATSGRILLNVGSDHAEVGAGGGGGTVVATPTRYATLLKGGL